jgi:hypothetical protein
MDTGYSRSPKLLKGAIIQFSAPLLIPIPNIIIFQYNPETITRSMSPWAPPELDEKGNVKDPKIAAKLSQPYDPQETFSVALELDAADALEHPDTHPVAVLTGVADRIAALEMLMYPPQDSALGGLLNISVSVSIGAGGISGGIGGAAAVDVVKRKEVPIILFFFGPGKIVPVRITSFQVEEQAFSPILYPIRAKVTVGIQVLPAEAFEDGRDSDAIVEIAKGCYKFTRAQKEALALANLANSVESILGMLPI